MGNSPRGTQSVTSPAPVHTFYSPRSWIEGSATQQLEIIASLPGVKAVAAMPDLHPGKLGPVGCAMLAEHVHPQFVGADIGCGMGLFQLDTPVRKLRADKTTERLRALEGPWEGDTAAALGLGYSVLEQQLAGGGAPLDPASEAGLAYLAEHDAAMRWAVLNRRIIAERAAEALRASLAHGAGRKYDRSSMHGHTGTVKSELKRLARNPLGGLVVCEDRNLLVEEAPDAYKAIDRVIADLVEFGMARVLATFRPLVTFKTARGTEPTKREQRGKQGAQR